MKLITVVGIGPGNIDYITKIAMDSISMSDIVVGGKRNIDVLKKIINNEKHNFILDKNDTINRNNAMSEKSYYILDSNFSDLKQYILDNIKKDITVLASGDPSVYGIADYIERAFSEMTEINIISGISSIQYAFSKVKLNMNNVYITSSHGREPNFDFIFLHDKIAMVTDSKIGPIEIAKEILSRELDYTIYVCENLSYDDENIIIGDANKILQKCNYGMCVIILNR
ncbi:precorrin-6y C5,15-methyltransferase (decarboxylating) subunit CbiE [Peptostreptococcus canis]|uniref:Precorrin-6y C5,15-methyltransferase (Decarboxylating) subunit CbiE n=1 Tax=Peptostreptococcus canis TaxID=1159213 RepID=A0ABR6TIS3_9FIRM|nr:precorrin-6y C5,15-methyltransferase (decarboxylating) subunit CbiE [Peptostreptococcus canis]